jgi:hypothetical protein
LDISGGEALVLLPDEFVELIFLLLADLTLHKKKIKFKPCRSYAAQKKFKLWLLADLTKPINSHKPVP